MQLFSAFAEFLSKLGYSFIELLLVVFFRLPFRGLRLIFPTLRKKRSPSQSHTQKIPDNETLLRKILQTIAYNKGDTQVAYTLLQRNLDKLDDNFIPFLQNWAKTTFPSLKPVGANKLAFGLAHFSDLMREFPEGDKTTNIEISIASYEICLTVFSRSNYAQNWGSCQNNLGIAYWQRRKGDKPENIEKAMACHTLALEVHTLEAFPELWAIAHYQLGSVFLSRIVGDRTENIEKAIAHYELVLRVYTFKAFPEQWGMVKNNFGLTYLYRLAGELTENQQQALALFKEALKAHTFKKFPQHWARIQQNFGNTYSILLIGDRAENMEKAISAFKRALWVYQPEALPIEWAVSQRNLGYAYINRILGDRAENLEEAIALIQRSLQIYTKDAFPNDWAIAQNYLGSAYFNRILEHKADNLEKAMVSYELALQVHQRETYPSYWAMIQRNLGVVYKEQEQNPKKAIAAFQRALQVYSPLAFPIECLETSYQLGNLALDREDWQQAIAAYRKGIKAFETIGAHQPSRALYPDFLKDTNKVYTNIVRCYVNLEQYDKAVEYVERDRARFLVGRIAAQQLLPNALTLAAGEYWRLQNEANRLRFSINYGGVRELMKPWDIWLGYDYDKEVRLALAKLVGDLEKRKQELWRQIRKNDPVLAGQLQVDPLKIDDIQQLIENEQTAILNFYTTNEDTYIFVLRQNSTTLHTCQGQGIETLQLWMGQNWLIPYLSNRQQWHDQLRPFLSELAQRLQLPQLIDEHLADIEELVIVPHLFLHQIPFAALPIANSIPTADSDSATDTTRGMTFSRKRPPAKKPKPAPTPKPTYLSDKYRLRVIPSCQILSYCHENQKKKKNPPSPQMGIVENATNDLPFSGYECQAIATTYNVPETLHLRGDRATPTNYRHLAQKVQLLHSSHHAEADLNNPLNSKLRLSGGEVTLGEIFTWRLPNLEEVFLACCETNFNPQTTPADDILVIAAGWLSAGALNVVSTLWAVDDCATALFSIFYYEQRRQQPTLKCSEALREAQFQLRNLTGEEFKARYRAPLEEYLRKIGKYDDLKRYCHLQHPFESPRYWAAFVSQGMN